MRKKKIVYNTDSCRAKTGYGRNSKEILKYLHSTGKYEIVEFACGVPRDSNIQSITPWKIIGTIPEDRALYKRMVESNPANRALINYGHMYVDDVVNQEKPDIFFGVNDIWAFSPLIEKSWWKKVNTVIHTTLDSLPILDDAFKMKANCSKFAVWASFAKEAMGDSNIDVIHGAFDTSQFYRLNDDLRKNLRIKNNIPVDAKVIGFVFRNQLRKSIPNLLDAFSVLQKTVPKCYLMLHTNPFEGHDTWNIPELIQKYGVDKDRVLFTTFCKDCGDWFALPYDKVETTCKTCGNKSLTHVNPSSGITENQLNEVYNLMDVYCHPFTSGGQEMPLQEAKLTELITLCPSYSCGSDSCKLSQGGIELEWNKYYEPNSNFIKATTLPSSIVKEILNVFSMDEVTRLSLGIVGRQYVIDNYDTSVIGKKIEKIIDELDFVDWSSYEEKTSDGVNCEFVPNESLINIDFAKSLFSGFFGLDEAESEKSGLNSVISDLEKGVPKDVVVKFFKDRSKQIKEKQHSDKNPFDQLLAQDDKRVAVVMPESAGDVLMATSLLKSISKLYEGYNIYFITKPAFFDILKGNKYIHKVLPFNDNCNNNLWLTGYGKHNGYFNVALLLHTDTQLVLNYINNGEYKTNLNIV